MRVKTTAQADRILDAAARLFGSYRFHEVRMEDIAAEADVGKGTLYRYFGDKEELYTALVTRASDQFLDRLARAAEQGGSARARLTAVVEAVLQFFDEQPSLFDLIQRTEVLQGPDFPWRQTRDQIFRLVGGLFELGMARGEFMVEDPEIARLMLLGGLRGVIRFGTRPRPVGLSKRIVAMLLHGCPGAWPVAITHGETSLPYPASGMTGRTASS